MARFSCPLSCAQLSSGDEGAVILLGGSLLRVTIFEVSLTLDGTSVINASLRCHRGKETWRDLFIEMQIQQSI